MSKTAETIVTETIKYISGWSGKYYSDYYTGLTNEPSDRLFSQHNVDEKAGCWIYSKAIDIENARAAEIALLKKGMKGGHGGGDDTSVYVYCYQITSDTEE